MHRPCCPLGSSTAFLRWHARPKGGLPVSAIATIAAPIPVARRGRTSMLLALAATMSAASSASSSFPEITTRRLDTLDEPLVPTAPVDPHARRERLSLRVVLGVLVLVGAAVFFQFVPWLVLAAWFAAATRPFHGRLAKILGGSHRAATLLTLMLLIALVAPMAVLGFSLVDDAAQLWERLSESRSGRAALQALVSNGEGGSGRIRFDLPTLVETLQSHSAQAFTLVDGLAGLALGLFVFFSAAYVFLVDGQRAMGWFKRNLPLADRHIDRFGQSFLETGRGLAVSVVLTGVLQAVIATILYVALDVPRALVLGVLTLFASIIPSVGTALVWVPLTIGLALSGRTTEAIVLGSLGTFVISGVDNLTRPIFARWGKLQLHSLVVLLAMLGGLAVLGPWGLFLGPLAVRWLLEALRIGREEHALG
jgi:predicted PurR-regulated permease PerM